MHKSPVVLRNLQLRPVLGVETRSVCSLLRGVETRSLSVLPGCYRSTATRRNFGAREPHDWNVTFSGAYRRQVAMRQALRQFWFSKYFTPSLCTITVQRPSGKHKDTDQ
jgi:hypothetical protein